MNIFIKNKETKKVKQLFAGLQRSTYRTKSKLWVLICELDIDILYSLPCYNWVQINWITTIILLQVYRHTFRKQQQSESYPFI